MNLSQRDSELMELMDDPACDPVKLSRTLRRFALINQFVSGWDTVYRVHLRPLLATLDRPARLLDIGCGAGDVLRRLVRLAWADGFEVEALGIDPDARALAVAQAAEHATGVTFRQMFSHELRAEGARFDIVCSNHVLHHLHPVAFDSLIGDSQRLATHLSLHSDIARSRFAYAAYSVGILPFAPGTLLRVDGLRSIRRSYTPAELRQRLPAGWRVERSTAFRLLAVYLPEPATS